MASDSQKIAWLQAAKDSMPEGEAMTWKTKIQNKYKIVSVSYDLYDVNLKTDEPDEDDETESFLDRCPPADSDGAD